MFVLLPQAKLQRFVFPGNLRIGIQIIAKIQLVMVAGAAQVQMKDPLGKPVFRIAFVKGQPAGTLGHTQIAGLRQTFFKK